MINRRVQDYLAHFTALIESASFTISQKTIEPNEFFARAFDRLDEVRGKGHQVFFIGNGASNSMASHFATDFTKNGMISSTAFTDGSLLTCYANDYSYETAFKEILNRQFRAGDALVAISSSGNSANIVNAATFIREQFPESMVIGLSGFNRDNRLGPIATHGIHVPGTTYGTVESAHSYFLHLLLDMYIEQRVNNHE